ncbi:MAG: GAF domain-containing protein [bacterium]
MENRKKNNLITRRVELVDLIREISFRILRQSLSEITEDIYFDLEKIAEIIGADYAYICFIIAPDELIDLEYAWTSTSVSPKKQYVDHEHGYFLSRLKSLDPFHISNSQDVPESAQVEADYIEKHKIKSLLMIPIESNNNTLAGYLAFEALSLRKTWDSDLYLPIKFFGEVLYSAVQKARAMALIRSDRDFYLVLNYANSLDECLDICLDFMLDFSGMSTGGIYLVKPEDKALSLVKVKNASKQFIEMVDTYSPDSFHYQLVSKGEPVYLSRKDLQAPEFDFVRDEGLTVVCALPITFRNELIGIVNLASHEKCVFPEFARTALETIAPRLGPLWYVFKLIFYSDFIKSI